MKRSGKKVPGGSMENGTIDEPPPTIVGPRPERGSGNQVTVPQGLERMLILAGLNDSWRRRLLADPLGTAAAAKIPLSPSETAILGAISPQTFGQMIAAFTRKRLPTIRDTAIAAGTAAAALLAATAYGQNVVTEGIRPDLPKDNSGTPLSQVPEIEWAESLKAALEEAATNNQAVMLILPYGGKKPSTEKKPHMTTTIAGDGFTLEVIFSPFLAELCGEGNRTVAKAVAKANLIAVKPAADNTSQWSKKDRRAYSVMLNKYQAVGTAPLVIFLAPDGTVLWRHRADSELRLVQTINSVPPRLATWLANKRKMTMPDDDEDGYFGLTVR